LRRALTVILLLAAAGNAFAATVSVSTPGCAPTLCGEQSGIRPTAPGYSTLASPGDPALIFREVHVILPPGAVPGSVTASMVGSRSEQLPGAYDIAPAPPLVTGAEDAGEDWGAAKTIVGGKNTAIYGADAFYPVSNAVVSGVGNLRKWRIATVRYYPYRWNPVTKVLELTTGGDIRLDFDTYARAASMPTADEVLADKLQRIAVNYDEAAAWYPTPSGGARITAAETAQATSGYLILTTAAVVSGSAKLQTFINHKTSRGFVVTVATETQWGGGTGDTAAERIRTYLKANYVTKGLRYVLLIGNPNPSSGDVPMKMLWPRRNSDTYREAPSDYYFADLTGNWDLDGDGFAGERDNDFGAGGIDRFPELIVGRIPYYGTMADLDSILQKSVDYESGVIGGAWVRNVLMSAKPSDASTPGYHLFEAIKQDAVEPAGLESTRVYEQTYGINPPPDYTPCNYSNVIAAWQQHAGFHFWWTHGSATTAQDIITSSDCWQLDDHYPSFTFQCSCENGYPENSGNLGYSLLKRGAVATVSASRVSWYYPGQTDFTLTDSNAGMTYAYALRLVRDHLRCGDAHFDMMVDVPNDIWMNHCVFNLYGDPSVAYAAGPVITHTPLMSTDVTTIPYAVQAGIVSSGPLKTGSPVIRWNTGGSSFNSVQMSLASGVTYVGSIPAQPYGTTVYYYIHAEDQRSQSAVSPASAPSVVNSFEVAADAQPPVIEHTPLSDTGDTAGPYKVRATVTDDRGVDTVTLRYNKNGATDSILTMQPVGGDAYEASIPGPMAAGDVMRYCITATDISLGPNTTRVPEDPAYYWFAISSKIRVAVLNTLTTPPYFTGGNANAYQAILTILSSDPAQRFQPTAVSNLSYLAIAGYDAIVLADNGAAAADVSSVASWFTQGKVILTLDSSTCYASYSGFLWPNSVNTGGYGIYWDYNAGLNDQQIVLADPITSGYSVGQIIDARGYEAQFYIDKLPADVKILARSTTNTTRAYAVYRDVPSKGRFVALGPYIQPTQNQYSMIREALVKPGLPKTLRVVTPNGGESFDAGSSVEIRFETSGGWVSSDRLKIEYTSGTTYYTIPGAESLPCTVGLFRWNTTGLDGSRNYRIRVSMLAGSVTDQSDAVFSIVPIHSIASAKSLADTAVVKFTNKVVTSNLTGFYYIEDPDRRSGIRIRPSQTLPLSALVTLVGTMNTVNGERVLDADNAQFAEATVRVEPLLIRTSHLGGAAFGLQAPVLEYRYERISGVWTRLFLPARGLNNVGLLIRLVGRVTYVGSDYFYLDDGCRCEDGSGNLGVKVFYGGKPTLTVGRMVSVSAISSTHMIGGNLCRALVAPTQDHIRVIL